ncbi:MAG: exodeoxyribonuclease V subunit gamma [Chlorobiaceae bacterium]|nr:exodeoxyribonuclease V subunit gamma [Chlorobiaceae bacterium]
MIELFTGNRLEELVSAFGDRLSAEPLSSPFEREMIVVQSRGMQRWLSMQLASRFGVWGGAEYPFPNALVQQLFEKLELTEERAGGSFSKEVMCWSLMRHLPGLLDRESFSPLRSYLRNDREGLKLFQLCKRVADTFDQYTLFRPELLKAWEEGREDGARDWQPDLWRAIVAESSGRHRGELKREFCRKLPDATLPPEFPKRISLFGVSWMPPYHIAVLDTLASRIPVTIFLLSPTQEYWSDIVSRRRLFRMSASERELSTEGNPLLASLGKSGREFAGLLLDAQNVEREHDLSIDPGADTLLNAMQSDMLTLQGTGEEGERRPAPDAADFSVQVHSCHNPLREVEVLHDNLLDLFDRIPKLEPRDIVVMTPEIELYAPYIATVFGATGEGVPRLPHSIADRRMLDEGAITPAMLKLLELCGSRLTAPELFDLIASPPISRRFRIDDEELDTIRRWIADTRIRWGMDEGSRSRLGLPPFRENSWRAGLERLLLGYAMPDEGVLSDGILPFDVEGEAETLGKLADFIDAVGQLSSRFERPATLDGWREAFIRMLDTFIEADELTERELKHITAEIDKLTELAAEAGFEGEVSAPVIIAWLRERLEKAEMGLGFMTGGITFCAMLPMRSIPFRVVAMIGMNDGAFPRQIRPPGFDMMSREPRKGDRSVRGDDRYLFLESILSARDVLYLSYVGQSIRDNSEVPPSVLVSELLDAVDRGFAFREGDGAASRLLKRHRLQGFNPLYFTDGTGFFSYSADNCRALEGRNSAVPRPFVDAPLPEPADEERIVTLDDLVKFFANPSAFFLERRLGLKAAAALQPLEEREPFEAYGLDAYTMRQEMLEEVLDGGDALGMLPLFRSRGLLPPATHGELLFRGLLDEVREFAAKVQELQGGGIFTQLDIDLDIGGFRFTGRLDHLLPTGQLLYRCARLRAQDRLRSWICHLVLHAMSHDAAHDTRLVTLDRAIRYRPVEGATERLETLITLYRQGLSEPLPFFPRASIAWAEKAEKSERERIAAATAEWREGYGGREGEGSDPAYRRCFGPEPPIGNRFMTIAESVLLPMLESGAKS